MDNEGGEGGERQDGNEVIEEDQLVLNRVFDSPHLRVILPDNSYANLDEIDLSVYDISRHNVVDNVHVGEHAHNFISIPYANSPQMPVEEIIRLFGENARSNRRDRIEGQPSENNDDDDTMPDNAEIFDTDLPAEHSYLGNSMVRVPGVDYLESGRQYRLVLLAHYSMVFPGETIPMIIPEHMFDSSLFPEEGILFGIIFPTIWHLTRPHLYGVTCQIFEKGGDNSRNVVLKSRAHQRFVISKEGNPNFFDLLSPYERKLYAVVTILPEIILPDPLLSINLGSMNRFRDINSFSRTLRRMQAATTVWPEFIYTEYDMNKVVMKAKKILSTYKIESMPNDMNLLSFWLARNLLLDRKKKLEIFASNSVNERMKIIDRELDHEKCVYCKHCNNIIANGNSLFAMSKHGVHTNYCNPSGFIHDTITVYQLLESSAYVTGTPSEEFSWFPGYTWEILHCQACDHHLGWKFVSVKPNVFPKRFYGLSGSSVFVKGPTIELSPQLNDY